MSELFEQVKTIVDAANANALRVALKRVMDERDFWRTRSQQLERDLGQRTEPENAK